MVEFRICIDFWAESKVLVRLSCLILFALMSTFDMDREWLTLIFCSCIVRPLSRFFEFLMSLFTDELEKLSLFAVNTNPLSVGLLVVPFSASLRIFGFSSDFSPLPS